MRVSWNGRRRDESGAELHNRQREGKRRSKINFKYNRERGKIDKGIMVTNDINTEFTKLN